MNRAKKGTPLKDKLLSRVVIDDVTGCWLWQGGTNNIGYGMIRDENKMRTTHRVSYEVHSRTKIPIGMCVCHECDNHLCVNPAHLWLGTMKQNINDMIDKGRDKFWGGKTRLGCRHPTTNCPHCNRDIANNVYFRYHGENCKLRKEE